MISFNNIKMLLKRLDINCTYSKKEFKVYEGNYLYIVYNRKFNSIVIHTLDKNGFINPMNSGHLSLQEAYEELKLTVRN